MITFALCFVFFLIAIFVILFALGPILTQETPEEARLRELEDAIEEKARRARAARWGGPKQ